MLVVNNLEAGYGDTTILRDISFEVQPGEIVSVVGSNGAGKSTLMRAITGLIKTSAGEVTYNGERITGLAAHKVLDKRIAMVPEGRQLFDKLTVYENLMAGAYGRKEKDQVKKDLEHMYEMFPILEKRKNQKAGTFSGGEQQMLAIARGLMSSPTLLILDEPSIGLSPLMMSSVLETVAKLRDEGLTIILVEQNLQYALKIADHGIVIQNGRLVLKGTGDELLNSELVKKAYLGM